MAASRPFFPHVYTPVIVIAQHKHCIVVEQSFLTLGFESLTTAGYKHIPSFTFGAG